MTDKPLDPAGRALLDMIAETYARIGRVERDLLNVEARGRGIEVGRALAVLKDAGLIEETETRPGFFGRLFGARPKALLRPLNTEAATTAPAPASDTAASEPAAAEPPRAETAAPVAQEAPAEAPEVAEPAPTETAPALPEAETPAAGMAATEPEPAVTEPAALETVVIETALSVTDTVSETVGTVTETVIVVTAPAEPAAVPEPVARPAPATPRPAPAMPRPHFAPDDYTDKVGGGDAIEIGPETFDPEAIDSLRETLAELGMDLTMAGESLIADRMTSGESAGDALSQVVLFAFAHAVHYDLLSGGGMQALGLTDYAIEVMKELEKLRDAGVIGAGRFEADMRLLWSFVGEDGELMRANRAAELLSDPVGGAAPPATLPEDLQAVEDPDDED